VNTACNAESHGGGQRDKKRVTEDLNTSDGAGKQVSKCCAVLDTFKQMMRNSIPQINSIDSSIGHAATFRQCPAHDAICSDRK